MLHIVPTMSVTKGALYNAPEWYERYLCPMPARLQAIRLDDPDELPPVPPDTPASFTRGKTPQIKI
uniref:Uncharacterized protein n=1 Tax=viral metagenome TaxID=1070528 RepID=A0A6M3K8B5_9ZZZZ